MNLAEYDRRALRNEVQVLPQKAIEAAKVFVDARNNLFIVVDRIRYDVDGSKNVINV